MGKMEEMVDQLEEEKPRAMIFAFLSVLLFMISIAGEVTGAFTSMANTGRYCAHGSCYEDYTRRLYHYPGRWE
jgi:hypothetical protein